MVSAVSSELDVVLGLELGATDYVTKPFHLRELVARIQAVLRRMAPAGRAAAEPRPGPPPDGPRRDPGGRTEISFGPVQVDFIRREVTVGERTVHLSRREFDLLAVLLSPARQVRTREELIDLLWPGRELTDSRTLDTHVHRLRTKLEPDPTSPRYLVTVRGVGFRLDPDGERPRPHTRPVTPGPVSAGPTPGRLSRSGR